VGHEKNQRLLLRDGPSIAVMHTLYVVPALPD
jgi:hypothetical protein